MNGGGCIGDLRAVYSGKFLATSFREVVANAGASEKPPKKEFDVFLLECPTLECPR
jgi:hypothetical protein